MKAQVYWLMHLIGLFGLSATVVYAIAAPKIEHKAKIMMISGMLAAVALVGGFGLLAVYKMSFSGWLIVKIICWFALAALAGMAFRMQSKKPLLITTTGLLIVIALVMVIFKPF